MKLNLFKGKNHISWMIPSSSRNPDKQLASVWIRALQIKPYLEHYGFKCALNNYFFYPEIAIFLRRYEQEDVELARRLKNKGTKIVLDVIVNYFEVYPPHPDGYGGCSKKQNSSFMALVELADEIWCVSPFLKSLADKYHPNVIFISDSVDRKHFSKQKYYQDNSQNPLHLGWSGVSVKSRSLEIFKPWIVNNKTSLLIISDKPPKLNVPYEFRKWAYKRFPEDIISCDICVAPRIIIDEKYDSGHSLFKIGVFMAEGVPVLASPIPSYELLLKNDKGGHICKTLDEWNEYIEKCLKNIELLKKWSSEAKEVIKPYLTENIAKLVVSRIKNLWE